MYQSFNAGAAGKREPGTPPSSCAACWLTITLSRSRPRRDRGERGWATPPRSPSTRATT